MALNKQLTVDDAIKKYDARATMRHKSYDTNAYAPNKMCEIIEAELAKGKLGKLLVLEYKDRYANRTLETSVIKVGTDDEWEAVGYLYNRKKGAMSGRYGSARDAYKNLVYVLQNNKCYKLHVYYV